MSAVKEIQESLVGVSSSHQRTIKEPAEIIDKLKEDLKIVCEKLQATKTECSNKQFDIINLKQELSQKQREVAHGEVMLKVATEGKAALERQYASLVTNKKEDLDKKILELDEKVLELDKKIHELDKKVLELDKKILELDKEVLELDKKILELDKKVLELEQNLQALIIFVTHPLGPFASAAAEAEQATKPAENLDRQTTENGENGSEKENGAAGLAIETTVPKEVSATGTVQQTHQNVAETDSNIAAVDGVVGTVAESSSGSTSQPAQIQETVPPKAATKRKGRPPAKTKQTGKGSLAGGAVGGSSEGPEPKKIKTTVTQVDGNGPTRRSGRAKN